MNVFDPAQLGWRCCRANPELRGRTRAATPPATVRREDTDFAIHPRLMPSGFSRGQASQVGRLRTASRRSNTNPTVVMRHVLLKNVLGSV